MRDRVYIVLRKLLDTIRKYRSYYTSDSALLRDIDINNIAIRRVTSGDIDALEKFLSAGDFSKHRRRLALQAEGAAEYLIAVGSVPVGHVLVEWDGGHDGPLRDQVHKFPLIEDLFVHAVVRGRGVGKLLMDAAEALIRKNGHEGVGLSVLVNNPAVERMYEKWGYTVSDLGVFKSARTFTDAKGREKQWSADVKYLTKPLQTK